VACCAIPTLHTFHHVVTFPFSLRLAWESWAALLEVWNHCHPHCPGILGVACPLGAREWLDMQP
jgi:hypothetical protein